VPFREPLQDLFEGDATLESRERGAEAEMGAEAERQVLADVAVDVEPVAVRVPAVVAVGRSDQEHHDASFGHRLAVVLRVAGDVARHMRRRRLEPEELLERVRDQ
jgi:hypothetical protein